MQLYKFNKNSPSTALADNEIESWNERLEDTTSRSTHLKRYEQSDLLTLPLPSYTF